QRFGHRPAEPRAGLLRPGPHTLIEAAEDRHVGLLQAGFERTPDEQAGVSGGARPRDASGGQAAIEWRGGRGAFVPPPPPARHSPPPHAAPPPRAPPSPPPPSAPAAARPS